VADIVNRVIDYQLKIVKTRCERAACRFRSTRETGPLIAHPIELTGNWLKDIGIAGGAFILAKKPGRVGDGREY